MNNLMERLGRSHITDIVAYDGESHVTTVCPLCGNSTTVTVPTSALTNWVVNHQYVQVALSMLNADNRALLLTGMCPACFDHLCSDGEG